MSKPQLARSLKLARTRRHCRRLASFPSSWRRASHPVSRPAAVAVAGADVDESPLTFAEHQVLQAGEGEEVVFGVHSLLIRIRQ